MSIVRSKEPSFVVGSAQWLVSPTKAQMKAERFRRIGWPWSRVRWVEWSRLRRRWVEPIREMGMEQRTSLDSASKPWFDWLRKVDRLAVTGVRLDCVEALEDLLGFVVEPTAELGIELVIGANQALEQLDPAVFVDKHFGYAYSFERLLWRLGGGRPTLTSPAHLPVSEFVLDERQAIAVYAGEGVKQIIAPAGSGKTAVLVERVRELRRRGAPRGAIACVTFNKAAAGELKERLKAAGVGYVKATTFHSLGYSVLSRSAGQKLNVNTLGPTQKQWRWLAVKAKDAAGRDGCWFDPPEAKRAVSDMKLGAMVTAQEYAARITPNSSAKERTCAALYTGYDELQRRDGWLDFDDLILQALLLLRKDASVREHWQGLYEYLLVDEYQDIEPAQELLVRIIAAPQDQIFAVGDEDQTLYSFRRASVERIICLDESYPALERVALGINYRCPPAIVAASRALIEDNKVRFKKPIEPAPGQEDRGSIALLPAARRSDSAVAIVEALQASTRGKIVVLARTTNALRPVALACVDMGVKIDAPEKLFKPKGALGALQQHLILVIHPSWATDRLVRSVCQVPGRATLSPSAASAIAQRLQLGESFEAAFAGIPPPKRDHERLLAPGELFTRLAACEDAAEGVALLRAGGGFDQWFDAEDALGGLDEFECEMLEQAEGDAGGLSLSAYLGDLELQDKRLKECRDSKRGIELRTIHTAKGRQWPHVILVACEEGVMPHKRSREVTHQELKRGGGLEAERRLGYVAFTRAKERLEIHYDQARASRFLTEAGLIGA
jgi:superfamily I DNA/RNA helicase